MNRGFSERMGFVKPRLDLQINDIDERLRNRLWNFYRKVFIRNISGNDDVDIINEDIFFEEVMIYIWDMFLGLSISPKFSSTNTLFTLERWFFEGSWYKLYDLIEFTYKIRTAFVGLDELEELNKLLEQENSGYRFVNGLVTPITSQQEINEIEEAAQTKYETVNEHLKTAIQLFSDRENPNYRNSMKEAISAVESLCCIVAEDENATLGKALAKIEKKGKLHGSLKKGFTALYGYTSDEGGIRHKLLEDSQEIKFEDAKFMLVSCSAFINYLIAKNTK